MNHLLRFSDLSTRDIVAIFECAKKIQADPQGHHSIFVGKNLVLLFDKTSTRTRLSFEVAAANLGINVIYMHTSDTQMKAGEDISDTARVISSMVDLVVIRNSRHNDLELFARYSSAPVISGLTDQSHPCQLLADLYTCLECFAEEVNSVSDLKRLCFTWVGDFNNMSMTYIEAAKLLNFQLNLIIPEPLQQGLQDLVANHPNIFVGTEMASVLPQTDVLITDVWFSLSKDNIPSEKKLAKEAMLKPYRITRDVLAKIKQNGIFLHCLPANKKQEVSDDLFDDPKSKVWRQAKNREVAQAGLLLFKLQD